MPPREAQIAATIDLGEDGSLTRLREAIGALRTAPPAKLEWQVENGGVLLRPAATAQVDDDVWAHSSEHCAAIERARADAEAGRTYTSLSEEFLLSLAEKAEALHEAGKELEREELHRILDAAVRAGDIKHAGAGD